MTSAIKNFRTDINGLRAWAVVAVVCYHFGIQGFFGGLVGVDVFFVISGFLMSGIIVAGLERSASGAPGRVFSIIGFYLSRARRIIPALLAVCAVLLVVGWLLVPATEYRMLGTHILAALFFYSNITFWTESGYFDTASHDKFLLHTWSLSAEWQFYIILPVMLWAVWKMFPGRKALNIVIGLAFGLSLLLSIIATPITPIGAFFLLPSRAWEMLAGSLVYMLANPLPLSPNARRGMEGAGFVLIIASILMFDSESIWPGWRAMVPVAGAMLVLMAARQGSWWTGTRVAQWLGDCSYSIYLWHWPLVVGLVYLQKEDDGRAVAIALLLTLLLGWLSYRFIECPTRDGLNRMPQWRGAGLLFAMMLVVAVPSLVVREMHGVPGRLPANIDAVFNEGDNRNPLEAKCLYNEFSKPPECTYGGPTLGAIVIGDSHAAAMVRGVERSLPSPQLHVLDWTMSNCPTIADVKSVNQRTYNCGKFVAEKVNDYANMTTHVPVIIINRTSYYIFGPNEKDRTKETHFANLYLTAPYPDRTPEFKAEIREGIIATACAFAKHGPVYMLRPVPELIEDVPKTMGRALMRGDTREVTMSMDVYRQRHEYAWQTQDMAAERCGVKILNPLPYLCHDGVCRGDVNGMPVYYDDDHLSERGATLLEPLFRQVFEQPAAQ